MSRSPCLGLERVSTPTNVSYISLVSGSQRLGLSLVAAIFVIVSDSLSHLGLEKIGLEPVSVQYHCTWDRGYETKLPLPIRRVISISYFVCSFHLFIWSRCECSCQKTNATTARQPQYTIKYCWHLTCYTGNSNINTNNTKRLLPSTYYRWPIALPLSNVL